MFLKIWAMLLFTAASVESLDPYQLFAEGSCAYFQAQPVKNLNLDELADMPYVVAGSRYQLLRHVSPSPRFNEISEDEFLACACMNVSLSGGAGSRTATFNGFGTRLTTFDLQVISEGTRGLVLDATPRNNFNRWDVVRDIVTLTDKRNFAFLSQCWSGSDQATWLVISRTRTLDDHTRKVVLEHAKQLGFSKENAVFLESENCDRHKEQSRDRGEEQGQRRSSQGPRQSQGPSQRENLIFGPNRNLVRPNIGLGELNGRRIVDQDSKSLRDDSSEEVADRRRDGTGKQRDGRQRALDNDKRRREQGKQVVSVVRPDSKDQNRRRMQNFQRNSRVGDRSEENNSRKSSEEQEGQGWSREDETSKESREQKNRSRNEASRRSWNSSSEEQDSAVDRRDGERRRMLNSKRGRDNDKQRNQGRNIQRDRDSRRREVERLRKVQREQEARRDAQGSSEEVGWNRR